MNLRRSPSLHLQDVNQLVSLSRVTVKLWMLNSNTVIISLAAKQVWIQLYSHRMCQNNDTTIRGGLQYTGVQQPEQTSVLWCDCCHAAHNELQCTTVHNEWNQQATIQAEVRTFKLTGTFTKEALGSCIAFISLSVTLDEMMSVWGHRQSLCFLLSSSYLDICLSDMLCTCCLLQVCKPQPITNFYSVLPPAGLSWAEHYLHKKRKESLSCVYSTHPSYGLYITVSSKGWDADRAWTGQSPNQPSK